MSTSVYALLEVYNKEQGCWDALNINFSRNGEETKADLYLGASSVSGAIFGEDNFDYAEEYDEDAPDKRQRYLDEIEAWFEARVRGSDCKLREDFSPATKETLSKYSYGEYPYTPRNITFTYTELKCLKQLAQLTSKRAANFYKKYFSAMEKILYVTFTSYSGMGYDNISNLRMIIYSV